MYLDLKGYLLDKARVRALTTLEHHIVAVHIWAQVLDPSGVPILASSNGAPRKTPGCPVCQGVWALRKAMTGSRPLLRATYSL